MSLELCRFIPVVGTALTVRWLHRQKRHSVCLEEACLCGWGTRLRLRSGLHCHRWSYREVDYRCWLESSSGINRRGVSIVGIPLGNIGSIPSSAKGLLCDLGLLSLSGPQFIICKTGTTPLPYLKGCCVNKVINICDLLSNYQDEGHIIS